MPITILDYVQSVAGNKPVRTAEDFLSNGVEVIGGCEGCAATIAAYNAYPSRSGYWRCADCIGDTGFATVEDFTRYEAGLKAAENWLTGPASAQCDGLPDFSASTAEADNDDPAQWWITCPSCGAVESVHETWAGRFECDECDAEWTL